MIKKLVITTASLFVIEIIVYLYAAQITDILDMRFQLSARYSARISFLMFTGLALWIGIEGMKEISRYQNSRKLLSLWVAAIGINHLIHFYFLVMNHHLKDIALVVPNSAGGIIVYLILLVMPVVLHNLSEWSFLTKNGVLLALAIVGAVFMLANLKRLFQKTELASSPYYYIGALIIIAGLLILNIYRLIEDNKKRSIVRK
ncbi:hypothetical protein [Reichenbachiella versicolor]|uniref:hypothetical protein n=1 Tax=Reichenbachiella versicolor TaxID=1821036 RepID=UPI000D6E1B5A|nr:hypothetical protein [Reichenbachiella versicolor]